MALERRILLVVNGLALAAALVLGFTYGEFWGFSFPLDLWFWGFAYATAGALITRAEPGHAVGRLLMWGALGPSLQFLTVQYASPWVVTDGEDWQLAEAAPDWLLTAGSVFGGGYLLALVLLIVAMARFPTGDWVTPMVGRLVWLMIPITVLGAAGLPELVGAILETLGLLAAAYVVGAIVVVSWRSGPLRRRQLGVVLTALVLWIVLGALSESIPSWLSMASMLLFPASIVVAITRYRLYELDRIVSRTLAYAVSVALLGGLYLVVVIGSRSLLGVQGEWPVALWTLAAAFALFPLARRVQGWVDKRFFRSRYDSASVVGAFADELRVTVDRDSLVERTESVVEETFQAESVGVWLADA